MDWRDYTNRPRVAEIIEHYDDERPQRAAAPELAPQLNEPSGMTISPAGAGVLGSGGNRVERVLRFEEVGAGAPLPPPPPPMGGMRRLSANPGEGVFGQEDYVTRGDPATARVPERPVGPFAELRARVEQHEAAIAQWMRRQEAAIDRLTAAVEQLARGGGA